MIIMNKDQIKMIITYKDHKGIHLIPIYNNHFQFCPYIYFNASKRYYNNNKCEDQIENNITQRNWIEIFLCIKTKLKTCDVQWKV